MSNCEDTWQTKYKQRLLECAKREGFPYFHSIKWGVYNTPTSETAFIQATLETSCIKPLNDYNPVDLMLRDLALDYALHFEDLAAIYRDWAGNNE